MDSGEINPVRQNFLHKLDFIKENIYALSIMRNEFPDMLSENNWIAKRDRFVLFKVNGDDVGIINSFFT